MPTPSTCRSCSTRPVSACSTWTRCALLTTARCLPSGLMAAWRLVDLFLGQREHDLLGGEVPDAHSSVESRGETLAVGTEHQGEDVIGFATKGERRPAPVWVPDLNRLPTAARLSPAARYRPSRL